MSNAYECEFHSLTVLQCAVLSACVDSNQSVPLASVPFEKKNRSLNSTLILKTSKSFIQLGEHKNFTRIRHLSVCTNLWSFSGDPYPVWWWLFLAYETWCFSKWHHFIAFWIGFPHMIILHDKFKTVHCYEATNRNIPIFLLRIVAPYEGITRLHVRYKATMKRWRIQQNYI